MDPNVPKLRQRSIVGGGQIMRVIYGEVFALTAMVSVWTNVGGGGNAACFYNQPGGGRTYKVRSQWGDMGNLVHEMTHVACNEAFGNDFVNYTNVRTANIPPREFNGAGLPENEALRQMKLMNEAENIKIGSVIQKLKTMAAVSPKKGGLEAGFSTKVVTKLDYAYQWPQIEYHTVINQVLVWLTEAGYPSIGHKKGKMPAANALYYEVEKIAARNWYLRVQGYQAHAA